MPRGLRKVTPAVGALRHGKTPSRFKTKRFDHGAPIAKIDTRPMAVLAVCLFAILLLLAKQQTHALLIDLPQPNPFPPSWESAPPYVSVEITGQGTAILDGEELPIEQITAAIQDKDLPSPIIAFSAEPDASYGAVAIALNALSKAGVRRGDICLRGLNEHRQFGKSSFRRVAYSMADEAAPAMSPGDGDRAIHGCQQFALPVPVTII